MRLLFHTCNYVFSLYHNILNQLFVAWKHKLNYENENTNSTTLLLPLCHISIKKTWRDKPGRMKKGTAKANTTEH
jgi:hypothetical protein